MLLKDNHIITNCDRTIFNKLSITDLISLKKFVSEKGAFEKLDKRTRRYILWYLNMANKAIAAETQADIYISNNYEKSAYNSELLSLTDKNVKASELLLYAPTNNPGFRFRPFLGMNIEEIKFLLAHTNAKGENSVMSYPNIGPVYKEIMIKAVKFYEEQVIRVANELTGMGISLNSNLFHALHNEKMQIVDRYIKDFFSYITLHGNHFAGYELSQVKIDEIFDALKMDTPVPMIEQIKNTITNYLTYDELYTDPIENGALNRLIRK